METFVGFVTVMESLLIPDSNEGLAYKIAIRGAALLSPDAQQRIKLRGILREFYDIRSDIVHEGHVEKGPNSNMGFYEVAEISRQLFLRYICLVYLGLEGMRPEWILPDLKEKLSSKGSRSKAIAGILDGLVLEPRLTEQLEQYMEQWGVHEDWVRRTTLRITGKLPEV